MDRVQLTIILLLNLISLTKYVFGEAVAYFPSEARSHQFHVIPTSYQPVGRSSLFLMPQLALPEHEVTQEQMVAHDHITPIHHTADPRPPFVPETPMQGLNDNIDEGRRDENYLRAKSGYDYPTHSAAAYPSVPSYSYTAPSTGYNHPASSSTSYSPPGSSNYSPASPPTAPSYAPSAPSHPDKFPLLKTDLTSLIKPVTTKVASKVSGLIGLVLSLLTGTAPDDLEMKGFKDIVINGIVKPLLIAKGGIKSLISKLTIPVISLLLINLEVLITVWWLWEECPESTKPIYNQPTYTPSYNSYR